MTRIAAGAALRTAGWSAGLALRAGRIVRRSIHLTPFGGHFCNYCLPVESAEIETLGTASSSTVDASA